MADPIPFDVSGPVTVEVFTVARSGSQLVLTGPCGAAPWLIESGPGEHPLDTAKRIVGGALPDLLLVHSTSWRYERDSVVLSFIAVIPAGAVGSMETMPVGRADLARGERLAAPTAIRFDQVVEHGLRHLSWLTNDDSAVSAALDPEWHDLLRGWVPEPFRQLP